MKRLIEGIDEELRLSRESREQIVEDFRALSLEMETRFERVARRFESQVARFDHQIAENSRALDSTLDAVNSQSRAIQHMLARLPPLADDGV